jgi:hypothetical protein
MCPNTLLERFVEMLRKINKMKFDKNYWIIVEMSQLLKSTFFIKYDESDFMLRKIIEDKYKEGLEHVFEYMEDLNHMIISKNHMNKTMGFDEKTKRCYFYNTEKRLYNMIISGMRQRYLVYKLDLFLRKKYVKIEYVNENDLYFESYKDKDILTTRENGCYYAFTKRDLRKIFHSGLMNIQEEIPEPKTPSNPYTRKEFNEYELMMMYEFMGKKTSLIELFRQSKFCLPRFNYDWGIAILRAHLIEKVKNFSMKKMYQITKRMCKVLKVDEPSNRCIKEYLSKYQSSVYMVIVKYYEFDFNMFPSIDEYSQMRELCAKFAMNIKTVGKQLIRRHRVGIGGNAHYNAVMRDVEESDSEDEGVESGDSSDEEEIEDLRIVSWDMEVVN